MLGGSVKRLMLGVGRDRKLTPRSIGFCTCSSHFAGWWGLVTGSGQWDVSGNHM